METVPGIEIPSFYLVLATRPNNRVLPDPAGFQIERPLLARVTQDTNSVMSSGTCPPNLSSKACVNRWSKQTFWRKSGTWW
jgi:hypothetical protein